MSCVNGLCLSVGLVSASYVLKVCCIGERVFGCMRCTCLMGGVCGAGVIGCCWSSCAGDGQVGIGGGDFKGSVKIQNKLLHLICNHVFNFKEIIYNLRSTRNKTVRCWRCLA